MSFSTDGNNNGMVTLATKLDPVNDGVLSYPYGHVEETKTADFLHRTGTGVLHTITFSCNDAAPTAGTYILYDNTAESGTIIFSHTFTTTPFVPFSVTLDCAFSVGLYSGFTTTADVNVTVSWRAV